MAKYSGRCPDAFINMQFETLQLESLDLVNVQFRNCMYAGYVSVTFCHLPCPEKPDSIWGLVNADTGLTFKNELSIVKIHSDGI